MLGLMKGQGVAANQRPAPGNPNLPPQQQQGPIYSKLVK